MIKPPGYIINCLSILSAQGYDAYLVGGCVRDVLMGREPSDWDICTNALPEQTIACFAQFKTIPTGIEHGTITVIISGHAVEITTFRTDGTYLRHRKPKAVTFTLQLQEDLSRRDFTVNAMAWNPQAGLIDFYNGQQDLSAGVIRCVGTALTRFTEDALRILRMFRFAAELNFSIDVNTIQGAAACSHYLASISGERMQTELCKLLAAGHPQSVLEQMADCGTLSALIPEFVPCINFQQHTPYHNRTVDRHIFAAVEAAPPSPLVIRLALLFHDIGKPACFHSDENGVGHFKGHAEKSALMTDAIMRRLRFDNDTRKQVIDLVRLHHISTPPDSYTLKRLLSTYGKTFVTNILLVQLADTAAKHSENARSRMNQLQKSSALLEQILKESPPVYLHDLAVDGEDLLQAGCPAGPLVGQLLHRLLDAVLHDPAINNKKDLLLHAAQILQQMEG